MRILTHPIFRLLSYIWKMKMPSRSNYFFSARFRHFHHGRGNQLKAGGLLVEKREQKSWLIQCQCHRAIEACDMPFTCPWMGTSPLAGWSANFPLHMVEMPHLMKCSSSFLDSHHHQPLLVCITHLSDVYDFDLSSYDHLSQIGDHFSSGKD